MRLGAIAIDLHLAALARTFGFGARLEQARDIEPDVETNGVWDSVVHVSLQTSDQDFDLALCFESVHERVGLLLAIEPLEVLLDLRLDLFERDGPARLLFDHFDDVEAEVGLDQIARRARGQGERGVVEGTDHLSLLEESEVASIRSAAGIGRVFFGKRGEVLARLHVLEDLLGLRARLRLGRRIGAFRHADQNVAGANAFALFELIGVLGVEVVDLRGL